jgi:hypothetical protein
MSPQLASLAFVWIGVACVVALSAALVLGLTTVVLDKLQYMWQCWSWAQRQVAAQDVGKNILHHSYEFSEHPETVLAIEALGEVLRDSDGWRIDGVVTKWYAKLDERKRKLAKGKKP